jgi:hypothetical protein
VGKPHCGGLLEIVYVQQNIKRSTARLFRYFFSRMDTPHILSCPWVGHVFDAYFGGMEGKGGSKLAAGVGASGGQPGSMASSRR